MQCMYEDVCRHTRSRYGRARSVVYKDIETDANSLGFAQIPNVFNVFRKDLHRNEEFHLNSTLDTPSEFAGAIGQLHIYVPLPYMSPCSFKVLSTWEQTKHEHNPTMVNRIKWVRECDVLQSWTHIVVLGGKNNLNKVNEPTKIFSI